MSKLKRTIPIRSIKFTWYVYVASYHIYKTESPLSHDWNIFTSGFVQHILYSFFFLLTMMIEFVYIYFYFFEFCCVCTIYLRWSSPYRMNKVVSPFVFTYRYVSYLQTTKNKDYVAQKAIKTSIFQTAARAMTVQNMTTTIADDTLF